MMISHARLVVPAAGFALVAACLLLGAGSAQDREGAQGTPAPAAKEAQPAAKRVGDPYPFDFHPITGEKFGEGEHPMVVVIDGRELRVSCELCVTAWKNDQKALEEKLDEKIKESQRPWYPLKHCLVEKSDELDTYIPAHEIVYGNRLIRFCCPDCEAPFREKAESYLKELDAAVVKAQKPDYPFDTCIVSGEKLGSMGEPVDHVCANRLIRLCCESCIAQFEENPARYLAMLDEARAKKAAAREPDAQPPSDR